MGLLSTHEDVASAQRQQSDREQHRGESGSEAHDQHQGRTRRGPRRTRSAACTATGSTTLPLADATTTDATAEVLQRAGLIDVTVTSLEAILELDRSHGVAPGHDVPLEYLVTSRRRAA